MADPKPSSALLDASRAMSQFLDQFDTESDRASVILAAAVLDDALLVLLKTHLVPQPSGTDDVFEGGNAPLSHFSARIDMAYRLGLVSKRLSRDLHLIRKIRNDFAHNALGCDFERSPTRDRLAELSKSFQELVADTPSHRSATASGRSTFQICVGWIVFYLASLVNHSKPLTGASEEWAYEFNKMKADSEARRQRAQTVSAQSQGEAQPLDDEVARKQGD